MKLADARENYYIFSGKTSDIIRQLALAGIAIVWLFRITENEATSIPQALVLPLVLIVLGLAFDLVQYAVATAVWGIYHRRKERQGVASDHEFEAPRQLNWPPLRSSS